MVEHREFDERGRFRLVEKRNLYLEELSSQLFEHENHCKLCLLSLLGRREDHCWVGKNIKKRIATVAAAMENDQAQSTEIVGKDV